MNERIKMINRILLSCSIVSCIHGMHDQQASCRILNFDQEIQAAAFTQNGLRLRVVTEGEAHVFQMPDLKKIASTDFSQDFSLDNKSRVLAFHPSKDLFAQKGADFQAAIIDIEKQAILSVQNIDTIPFNPNVLAFNPQTAEFAAAIGSPLNTYGSPWFQKGLNAIGVTAEGNIVKQYINDPTHGFCALSFNADGSSLAGINGHGLITIFNDEQKVSTVLSSGVKYPIAIAFSPNGKRIALANDERLAIMDIESKKIIFDVANLRLRDLCNWRSDEEITFFEDFAVYSYNCSTKEQKKTIYASSHVIRAVGVCGDALAINFFSNKSLYICELDQPQINIASVIIPTPGATVSLDENSAPINDRRCDIL